MAQFSEFLRRATDAGHVEREIAVKFVSDQAPEAADLLDMVDDEPGLAAQLAQPVRAVPKVVMGLFV